MKVITTTCRFCEETHKLHVNAIDFESWKQGELIQNAMPYMDISDRELLISETCGECWEDMFGEDDDLDWEPQDEAFSDPAWRDR
jgi:hypothetical protein